MTAAYQDRLALGRPFEAVRGAGVPLVDSQTGLSGKINQRNKSLATVQMNFGATPLSNADPSVFLPGSHLLAAEAPGLDPSVGSIDLRALTGTLADTQRSEYMQSSVQGVGAISRLQNKYAQTGVDVTLGTANLSASMLSVTPRPVGLSTPRQRVPVVNMFTNRGHHLHDYRATMQRRREALAHSVVVPFE